MKKLKPRAHMVDFLFALALFCVFAATALLVALIGAKVYKGAVSSMNLNFERRTSLSYVATKIRQFDREGSVALGDLGGIPAIVLRQEAGGNAYVTMIYHYDGALRELSVREGLETSPEGGSVVLEVDSFRVDEPAQGLFSLEVTDKDGNPAQMLVSVQCAAGR